ncbi:hypothetical protein A2U01_0106491, partial [Trifolium medium]|nr:hypothetical protein [Trifolium medium]
MGWRDAPVQNSKLKGHNGYPRVAQDRWRGARAREIVQNQHSIKEETVSIHSIPNISLFLNPYH